MKTGLTGDIGSGKSTVLGLFAKHGCKTISADVIVHDLLASDHELIGAICDVCGKYLRLPEGGIDRSGLAGVIFKQSDMRKQVEGLIHPKVREVWETFCLEHAGEKVVVEIPLLFEKNLENSFDHIVSVFSSFEVKSKRLKERGMNEADIRDRLAAQTEQETKANRSDFLILNNGSLKFLETQVMECILKW